MYQHIMKLFSSWLQSRRYGRRQTVRLETSIVDKEFNHMMKFYQSATSSFPWRESKSPNLSFDQDIDSALQVGIGWDKLFKIDH